jgi:hypothetical protein
MYEISIFSHQVLMKRMTGPAKVCPLKTPRLDPVRRHSPGLHQERFFAYFAGRSYFGEISSKRLRRSLCRRFVHSENLSLAPFRENVRENTPGPVACPSPESQRNPRSSAFQSISKLKSIHKDCAIWFVAQTQKWGNLQRW